MQDLLPHLSPSLESIAELDEQRRQAMVKEIKDIGFVNLNESSLTKVTKPVSSVPSYELAGLSEVAVAKLGDDKTGGINQVLGVLEHLVLIGSWVHASALVHQLEASHCFDVYTHQPLKEALCLYLHAVIDPVYQQVSPRGMGVVLSDEPLVSNTLSDSFACMSPLTTLEELSSPHVLEPLRLLGSGLSSDLVLFAKLCRLMHKAIEIDALKDTVYDMLNSSVLICCSMFDTNPGLVMEVWEVLSKIPVGIRCQLYEAWLSGSVASDKAASVADFGSDERPRSLELVKAEAEANQTMKQLLKRISNDKKKLKQDQRAVARVRDIFIYQIYHSL